MIYSSFNVTDPQHFKAVEYPRVVLEMELLRQALVDMPEAYKADIFISYLKDHCINSAWVSDNPVVTRQALSENLATTHIERLFNSCRQNTEFLSEFEDYFKNVMSGKQ